MYSFFVTVIAALAASGPASASPVDSSLAERAPNVSCASWTPLGWKSNKAVIGSNRINPDVGPPYPAAVSPYLGANMTITPDGYLYLSDRNISTGSTLHLEQCNATSLGLTSSQDGGGDCSDSGCYQAYYHTIRVRNPVTGHCLGQKHWNVSGTSFVFRECDPNPPNPAQFFFSEDGYNYDDSGTYYYSALDFEIDANLYDYPFQDWSIRKDNRTIKMQFGSYSQVGVGLQLTQA